MSSVAMIVCLVFFFNDTATTEIYTLSLHDALPISRASQRATGLAIERRQPSRSRRLRRPRDRKSTRLNSSHLGISYAVLCLKKKTQQTRHYEPLIIEKQRRITTKPLLTNHTEHERT